MKIYSTYKPRPVHVCENSGEDIVIPDDSLSVVEILSRFQRGLPTDIHERPMMYDSDDSNFEYPEDMEVDPLNEFNDFSDIYDMSEELASSINTEHVVTDDKVDVTESQTHPNKPEVDDNQNNKN